MSEADARTGKKERKKTRRQQAMEQMSIFDFIENPEKPKKTKEDIKPLIDYKSLSWYKTMCPYCKFENPEDPEKHTQRYGRNYHLEYWQTPLDICPSCGRKYDRDHPKIVMSKDYAECKRLGLHGAVRKNEKGQWEESPINREMTKGESQWK